MSIEKKPWGHKEHIHDDGTVSVDLLVIDPGGYCSKHSHKLLINRFFLLEGVLTIELFQKDNPEELQDKIVLGGAYFKEICIPAKYIHRFRNHGNTVCKVIEVAYILNWNSESDIDRLDVGGIQ